MAEDQQRSRKRRLGRESVRDFSEVAEELTRKCSTRSAKFTREQTWRSLYLGCKPETIKKRLQHNCFTVSFCEIFYDTFFTEHILMDSSKF